MALEQRAARRRAARVGELDERLVEQHDDALGQRVEQRVELGGRTSSSPVGSLGLHSATTRVRSLIAAQDALGAEPGTGTARAVRAPGHQRVERIGGPRRDQLVARLDQRLRGGAEQLGGAVADDDLLARRRLARGELAAQLGGVRVG